MSTRDTDQLVVLNDACLERLIRAHEEEVDDEIGRLIVERVRPLARAILSRYSRTAAMLTAADAEDIASNINHRLLAKLRLTAKTEEHAVRDFDRYVATLSFNAINDYLRKAFPARARLKNRLRYAILHDQRLAFWTVDGAIVAGLKEWSGTHSVASELPAVETVEWPVNAADGARLGAAIVLFFRQVAQPAVFDMLVSFVAEVSHVVETPQTTAQATTAFDFEMREYLRALWRQITDLRPLQRRALLLNLRSGDTTNLLAVIVLGGIATFDDVAAAIEMPAEKLAAIWNDLPLDDNRIAELLGMTRQQVINLRKSARDRLSRRMERNSPKS